MESYITISAIKETGSLDRPWGMENSNHWDRYVGGLLVMTGAGVGYTAGLTAFEMTFGPDEIRLAADGAISMIENVAEDIQDIEKLVTSNNPVAKYLRTFVGSFWRSTATKQPLVSCISILCKETYSTIPSRLVKQ